MRMATGTRVEVRAFRPPRAIEPDGARACRSSPDVTADLLERKIEEHDVDRRVRAEEREMAMGSRPLRAVGEEIDLRQVCMNPQTPAPKELPKAFAIIHAKGG